MKKFPLSIIRDTREQDGFDFKADLIQPPPILTTGTLATGDYSLAGYQPPHRTDETDDGREYRPPSVAVERKSLADLMGCMGRGRARFQRELRRLKDLTSACVVVEEPMSAIRAGHYRGSIDPETAVQTVISWQQAYGVPFIFCAGKDEAERVAFDFLRHFAIHRAREWRKLTAAWDAVERETT